MQRPDPRSLLVVGAGLAGWRTAKETRKAGFEGPITVLSDEDEVPYDRPPLSKQVLTGEREPRIGRASPTTTRSAPSTSTCVGASVPRR